jgi:hypothetical protein
MDENQFDNTIVGQTTLSAPQILPRACRRARQKIVHRVTGGKTKWKIRQSHRLDYSPFGCRPEAAPVCGLPRDLCIYLLYPECNVQLQQVLTPPKPVILKPRA